MPEAPSGTLGRPVARILSTARSASESPPMTRATYERVGVVDVVTVIRCPPSTTWKFVTTIPSDRMMNPVPTPRPGCEPPKGPCSRRFVVTFTTAGRTCCTTWTTGSAFGSVDGSGAVGLGATGWFLPPLEAHRGRPLELPEVRTAAAQAVPRTESTAREARSRFITYIFAVRRPSDPRVHGTLTKLLGTAHGARREPGSPLSRPAGAPTGR